ncbi:helicase [Cutibacterium acnes JCM 18918]|nr:helicase [Cutibacterium acnes JCM 18918]
MYEHQEEAILEILSGNHVIVTTPTGSGKSLIATAAHFACVAAGGRSYYTAPIKALVSEKFFSLCEIFGAANVGMVTGDASVNADAPSSAAPPRSSLTSLCARAITPASTRSSWMSSTSSATPTAAGPGKCHCPSFPRPNRSS